MLNERIKKIRKDADMTQEEFACKLGVKRNTVATYEMGRSDPSNAALSLICREFSVNEQWLRTGEGEPYIELKTNNLVAQAAALLGEHDPVFEAFIETYSILNKSDREVIKKIGFNFLNNLKSRSKEE